LSARRADRRSTPFGSITDENSCFGHRGRDASCRLRLCARYRQPAQQPIHPGLQAPSYQQGSGQRAGGPANELNTNGPMTTGTIVVPVPAEPMPPSGIVGVEVMPSAPPVLDGKGQAAGGYVGEVKRRDGIQ